MKLITNTETFLRVKNSSLAIICCCVHWTAPCISQEKVLSHFIFTKLPIYYLELDKLPHLAWELGIKTVPTILIFKQGKEKQRFSGVQSSKWFQSLLDNIKK